MEFLDLWPIQVLQLIFIDLVNVHALRGARPFSPQTIRQPLYSRFSSRPHTRLLKMILSKVSTTSVLCLRLCTDYFVQALCTKRARLSKSVPTACKERTEPMETNARVVRLILNASATRLSKPS
jgi:hypothetical protein